MAADSRLEVPAAKGPSLSMVANPNDPLGKLLVVIGLRFASELKRAAAALTLGGQALPAATWKSTRWIRWFHASPMTRRTGCRPIAWSSSVNWLPQSVECFGHQPRRNHRPHAPATGLVQLVEDGAS